jgi:hypothetical protein
MHLSYDASQLNAVHAGWESYSTRTQQVICVERDAHRAELEGETLLPPLLRARITRQTSDIRDFELPPDDGISTIVLGKHLCGLGTDCSIDFIVRERSDVVGCVFATCCLNKICEDAGLFVELYGLCDDNAVIHSDGGGGDGGSADDGIDTGGDGRRIGSGGSSSDGTSTEVLVPGGTSTSSLVPGGTGTEVLVPGQSAVHPEETARQSVLSWLRQRHHCRDELAIVMPHAADTTSWEGVTTSREADTTSR